MLASLTIFTIVKAGRFQAESYFEVYSSLKGYLFEISMFYQEGMPYWKL